MDQQKALESITKEWDKTIVPTLEEYIKIPNQSPAYDDDWATNGLMEKAVDLLVDWVKKQSVNGLSIKVLKDEGRTPLIVMELEASKDASIDNTVLLYGHMDKQPPLTEDWDEGLGPYKPVIRDGKLYGRGGADDGYSIFASVMAIKVMQEQNLPHGRMITLIEASEESGSPDLPYYIEKLKASFGDVALVICLDSGCGNYDQFWLTTSLRGVAAGVLTVSLLSEGVHSGAGSGIISSSFRVTRQLLDRVEDSSTGKVLLDELYTEIPKLRIEQAKSAANFLGDSIYSSFPLREKVLPVNSDLVELLLNKTWRPQLSIVGAGGMPPCEKAGNVLRRETQLKLSFRLPPGVSGKVALDAVKKKLTENPPYGADVEFEVEGAADGWQAPLEEKWLSEAVEKASLAFYKKPAGLFGEGGTIPFMGMLGKMFPKAQFIITGVLGPKSNAHGPNEFLHIEFAKKLNACVAQILFDFYNEKKNK